jgi:hypothetical protein
MSLIDTTFGPLGPPLINKWGMAVDFVRKGAEVYNSATGVIAASEAKTSMKAVVARVKASEFGGIYQSTDVKVIPDPALMPAPPVRERDYFEYQQAGETIRAKVVDVIEYRGDSPVLFVIIARPQ